MKKSHLLLLTSLAVAGLFLAGCKKDDGSADEQAPVGVSNEEQAMRYYAQNDEFVQNDEQTYADNAIQPFDYSSFGKVDAALTPLRFGRFVTSVTKTVTTTVQPGDTIAIAVVEKTVVGVFRVKGTHAAGDTVVIEKPFTDHSTRNIIFKRVDRNVHRYWLNWVPVASSLVDGGTVNPATAIDIQKYQMFLPSGDTITVVDPNNYYLRYKWLKLFNGGRKDIPELMGGQQIRLAITVKSASADTDLVALRYGFGKIGGFDYSRRLKLACTSETNNGDGTYTRVFETSKSVPVLMHMHRGSFNMGIDAMTKATLYDDATTNYSVSWWGIPYRVF